VFFSDAVAERLGREEPERLFVAFHKYTMVVEECDQLMSSCWNAVLPYPINLDSDVDGCMKFDRRMYIATAARNAGRWYRRVDE
jgi:hypothetical protein